MERLENPYEKQPKKCNPFAMNDFNYPRIEGEVS